MVIEIHDVEATLDSLASTRADAWTLSACGVTRSERTIPALVDRDAYAPNTRRARVLLIGGLSGRPEDVGLALKALELFEAAGESLSAGVALTAVPCANPGGLAALNGPYNGAGGVPGAGYPPRDGFFYDRENPEARHIWRWTCYQAPDLVLELRLGEPARWDANAAAKRPAQPLDAGTVGPKDSLLAALGTGKPDGPGPIPGLRLTVTVDELDGQLDKLWALLRDRPPGPSPARAALNARHDRTPLEVGRDLAVTNGRTLTPLIYTQGVAISGRLRLGALDPDRDAEVEDVGQLVAPVVADPSVALGKEPGSADLAAVVWAEELAASTSDRRCEDTLVVAANYIRSEGAGEAPWPLNPNFIVEDMFFASAVLGRAFRVTGSERYLDLLTEFLLGAGTQEEGGLFPHSRRGPYHWGRGNGFAAMGLAEALTYLPDGHQACDAIVAMCRKQMGALRPLQEPSGMYLQVVDFPGSYQEFTATCMIGYSMARGLRLGWLDVSYREAVDLAWLGVSERVDGRGNIVDGCTGTGVMDNLRSYLDRPANSGYDDRSGSMALWFAAEMERLSRGV